MLVVDDERGILATAMHTLPRHGYTTIFAHDGSEAMAHFEKLRGASAPS